MGIFVSGMITIGLFGGQFYLARKSNWLGVILPVLVLVAGAYIYFYTGEHSDDRESLIRIGTLMLTSTLISMSVEGNNSRKKKLQREKDRLDIQDL